MNTEVSVVAADWPAPPGIVAGCTLRSGGVSDGVYGSLNLGAHVGDDPQNVRENRRRFVAGNRLPGEPSWLNQVHGNKVLIEPGSGNKSAADAVLSRRRNTVCAVLTADCLPVVLTTTDGREIAAAHAGWRGLCAGVLENTVAAFAASPGRILAWLGPAISQTAFEVGDEVRKAFLEDSVQAEACFSPNQRGRWQADLYALAKLRLQAAGVGGVYGGDWCTYDQPEQFFSYRRDGQCGRMATFILHAADD
jgi:YfiH family protein